jgi:hypothetical protein
VLINAESDPTGTTEARDAALHAVVADANVDNAEAIIVSAAMSVKTFTPRPKNTVHAKHGKVSGLVMLIAAIVSTRACYEWQWSVVQKVWVSLPEVFETTTSTSGLTPATTYYFRYKTVSPAGVSDWSQVVGLLMT